MTLDKYQIGWWSCFISLYYESIGKQGENIVDVIINVARNAKVTTEVATNVPIKLPSIVLFGDTLSNNLFLPKNIPPRYANVSVNHVIAKIIMILYIN